MIPGLEAALDGLAARGETTTYGALARLLAIPGPGSIAQLTTALERLMEADAAQNRPLRAALVCARNTTLPAPGFFQKAAALGRYAQDDPAAFAARERLDLAAFPIGPNIPQGVRGM